jgi:pilus assembly protein CpaB
MRMVFGLVLAVGLALAGVAVFMAQGYIKQTQTALEHEREMKRKTGNLVEVFVVNKALNYGDVITQDDVQMIYWQESALPEGVFHDAALLFPEEGKKPRYVLRQMEKFEPILAVKVTEPGEPAGLTGQLAKGMRAFAVKVDVASGVSGFVQPGDRVDIYWTGSQAGIEGEMTRLIESTVKIIAVDQTADGNAGGAVVARTVTVAATPEQVARLAQAQATGRLALSLVGSGDETVNAQIEVDGNGLLGIQEEQIVAVEEEKICTVKTRKGADVLEMPIPCTN